MWVKCNLCWCFVVALGGVADAPVTTNMGNSEPNKQRMGCGMGLGMMLWLKQEDVSQHSSLWEFSLSKTWTDVNLYYFQSECMWVWKSRVSVYPCLWLCVYSGKTWCMLAAAYCQYGNSSQSLSIQVELQPEEIQTSSSCFIVCHKALPVTSHALRLCLTLLGTRERTQIGKGKSATPQAIKHAAQHLSKLIHSEATAWTHTSMNTHPLRSTPVKHKQAQMKTHTHLWMHITQGHHRKCQYEWLMMTQLPTHTPFNTCL